MYFKTSFLHCCRHIISVFLGVVETIVGSLVRCGVGTILNKATNNFLLSALCTEAGQRSSLLISPSRDIAKQQRNNRLKDTVGHHELLLKRVWFISDEHLYRDKKRERKQRRRGRQRKRPIKSNRFRLTKQQLRTCITLFCTFVYFFAATARFVWDVNTRQGFPFSFPELRWILLGFNCRKNCQNWTNWTRWNKPDKV